MWFISFSSLGDKMCDRLKSKFTGETDQNASQNNQSCPYSPSVCLCKTYPNFEVKSPKPLDQKPVAADVTTYQKFEDGLFKRNEASENLKKWSLVKKESQRISNNNSIDIKYRFHVVVEHFKIITFSIKQNREIQP